jgi:hypothetical protein
MGATTPGKDRPAMATEQAGPTGNEWQARTLEEYQLRYAIFGMRRIEEIAHRAGYSTRRVYDKGFFNRRTDGSSWNTLHLFSGKFVFYRQDSVVHIGEGYDASSFDDGEVAVLVEIDKDHIGNLVYQLRNRASILDACGSAGGEVHQQLAERILAASDVCRRMADPEFLSDAGLVS